MQELYWAAGFLEGEGSFMCRERERVDVRGRKNKRNHGGHPIITCVQVQKQPLERLQKVIGGHIKLKPARPNSSTQAAWLLSVTGPQAPAWMMTLWTLMSPRRREQIERALIIWKTVPPSPFLRKNVLNRCKDGHELTPENTYLRSIDGERCCRVCRLEYGRKHDAKRRLRARERLGLPATATRAELRSAAQKRKRTAGAAALLGA